MVFIHTIFNGTMLNTTAILLNGNMTVLDNEPQCKVINKITSLPSATCTNGLHHFIPGFHPPSCKVHMRGFDILLHSI